MSISILSTIHRPQFCSAPFLHRAILPTHTFHYNHTVYNMTDNQQHNISTQTPTINQILTNHALPGPTILSQGKFNRFNLYRKNVELLDLLHNTNQHVLYLCHYNLKPLVQKQDDSTYIPIYVTAQQLIELGIPIQSMNSILLGVNERYDHNKLFDKDSIQSLTPLYAISFDTQQQADSMKSLHANTDYMDVRTLLPTTSIEHSALLGCARTLVEWHSLNQYCGKCGSTTQSIEGGCKRKCSSSQCHRTVYPRVDPVIIVLIVSHTGDKVLLGRKHSFPAGMHTCIAGFLEPGESIEEGAVREVCVPCLYTRYVMHCIVTNTVWIHMTWYRCMRRLVYQYSLVIYVMLQLNHGHS